MKLKSKYIVVIASSLFAHGAIAETTDGYAYAFLSDNPNAQIVLEIPSTPISKSEVIGNTTLSFEVNAQNTPYVKSSAISNDDELIGDVDASLRYSFSILGNPNSVLPLNILSQYSFETTNYNSEFPIPVGGGGVGLSTSFTDTSGAHDSSTSFYCTSNFCSGSSSSSPDDLQISSFIGDQQVDSEHPTPYIYMQSSGNTFTMHGKILHTLMMHLDSQGLASGVLEIGSTAWAKNTSAQAYIDPYLYLDQNYLSLHPNTEIILSANVGNVNPLLINPIPEPATSSILIAGLILIGATRKKHQQIG